MSAASGELGTDETMLPQLMRLLCCTQLCCTQLSRPRSQTTDCVDNDLGGKLSLAHPNEAD